ncbi:MAG TPA: ASKHA domain-containing protein [Nitrospirota bacterium]|nr:ASKHA domain-containing protein [Nitrospirota bacterium]
MNGTVKLHIRPLDKVISLPRGGNLLDAFLAEGVDIPVLCNKNGSCGKCRVVVRAPSSPLTDIERFSLGEGMIAEGYRLACKTEIRGGGDVVIPVESREDFLEGVYWGNELAAIKAKQFPYTVDRLPSAEGYAAALDLGTTTLTGYLFDDQGNLVSHCSCVNPTALYGSDVVSRMSSFHQSAEDFVRLRSGMLSGIGRVIHTLCSRASGTRATLAAPERIERIALCGNTVMQHIFLGVNPIEIGLFPYAPIVKNLVRKNAGEVAELSLTGLADCAEVILSPSVWGFIGGDAVCGVVATELHRFPEPSLLLDIGTNGEMVLSSGGSLFAFSVSAGPAFEGYRIGSGMRATAGAIDRIDIDERMRVNYRVIGDVRPKGICGTGAVSAVATLLKARALTEKGHIRPSMTTDRLGTKRFVIAPAEETATGVSLVFDDKDVEVIQQAKAAFASGITALLRRAGLQPGRLRRIFLAGSFGSSADADNLKVIGLIPAGIGADIVPAGNAAGLGVSMLLLCTAAEQVVEDVSRKIVTVDAASLEEFEDDFMEALFFSYASDKK